MTIVGELESVPEHRVQSSPHPLQSQGRYVLYWMIAHRRTRYNFALQHATCLARKLKVPLLVFEPLRVAYSWASDRIHQFIMDGMDDNAEACSAHGVRYIRYLESQPGAGAGLLEALSADACAVVTDLFPCFFIPRMVEAARSRSKVRFDIVDGNGIIPLSAPQRIFTTAASFRWYLQKNLPFYLQQCPVCEPLEKAVGWAEISPKIIKRWPELDQAAYALPSVADLPLDHRVQATGRRGGMRAGRQALEQFLDGGIRRYATDRNLVENGAASGLSEYLHFGFVSSHECVARVLSLVPWDLDELAPKPTGKRHGWWNLPDYVEAFLDQIITWRELGYVFCHERPDDYGDFESLPEWAQITLNLHADDPRPYVYDFDTLNNADTHDPIWNAAQRELRQDGRIHNYLRMLWAKKILEWSSSPREALKVLIELNNKYALDGRNPNSYSGIFWTLGRFDRAWGPERPIFGKVRYMSSDSTKRKLKLSGYLKRFSGDQMSLHL